MKSAADFPQIAIAIGVLTSNRGGGRRTTLVDWTWHHGAIAGCSGRGAMRGAIVVCYGGNFGWCHCRAIAVCYGCRGGDDQLWGSGRGAIDMVPLLGAIVGCHCSVLW